MANKIEHSLSDKVRQLDELQQRADKFSQFARNMNKEMLAQGQQMMQFVQQFNQLQTGQQKQPVAGLQTVEGRRFVELVAKNDLDTASQTSNVRNLSDAQKVLRDESIRLKNAKMAGVNDSHAPSPIYSKEDVAQAKLLVMSGEKPSTQLRYGSAVLAPPKRPQANLPETEEEFGPFITGRDLDRLKTENQLRGKPFLTSPERQAANDLIATGGPKHLKYDIVDVANTQRTSSKFGMSEQELSKRAETLKAFSGPNQEITRTLGIALEKMTQEMKNANGQYLAALKEFQAVQANPEVKEDSQEFKTAFEKLQVSMDRLTETNQDLSRINKAAKEGGGGEPPRSKSQEFLEKARPYAQAAAAVLGAGVATYAAYQKTGIALDQAALGAERAALEARGGIGATISQRNLASVDMTNPENIIKYRGDILFGNKYDYLGRKPNRLFKMSNEETEMSLDIARRQKNMGYAGAIGSGILGAGQTVAGSMLMAGSPVTGGLSAPVGAAMAAGGVGQMSGAVGSAIETSAGNRYLQATGNTLENSFIGRFFHGDERSRQNTRYMRDMVAAQERLAYEQRLETGREAEMREKHSDDLIAMQERESLVQAQQQGAMLVGEYAVNRQRLMSDLFGPRVMPTERKRRIAAEAAGVSFSERSLNEQFNKENDTLSPIAEKHLQEAIARSEAARPKMKTAEQLVKMAESGQGLTPAQEKLRQAWIYSGSIRSEFGVTDREKIRAEAYRNFVEATPQIKKPLEFIEQNKKDLYPVPMVFSNTPAGVAAKEEYLAGMSDTKTPAARLPEMMETRTSRLQMTPTEFMNHQNMLTNVLGSRGGPRSGIEATADETERMVLLGRSGLGSFQQMLGDVAAINQVQGGQNNIGTLERVLASAVQAGFDKSRTAQAFVQATTDIARSVNVANVASVGRVLGAGATALSTTGVADERSLAAMTAGMKTYADYSGQRGGLVGALKMQSIFASGGRIGSGAGLASGLNAAQSIGMLDELDEYEKSGGKTRVKSRDLQDMLTNAGGDAKKVRAIITGAGGAGGRVMQSVIQGFGNYDVNAELKKAADLRKQGKGKEADDIVQKTIAKAAEFGEVTDLGKEGARAWAAQEAVKAGAIRADAAKGLVDEKIQAARAIFDDPARKNRQKYLDDLLRQNRDKTTGVTITEAIDMNKEFGAGIRTSKGEMIDKELYSKAQKDPELMQRIKTAVESQDRLELTRNAELAAAKAEGDVQRVHIVNIREMALTFLQQRLGTVDSGPVDHNSSTGKK